MKKYTLHEAALAVCGLKSLPILKDYEGAERAKQRELIEAYYSASGKIERAVVAKKLNASLYGYVGISTRTLAEYQEASGKVGPGVEEQKIVDISRDDLIAFMRRDDPTWQPAATLGGDSASVARRKPTYTTKLIELQDRAIEKFWLNYDLQRPPKGETIIDWFKNEGASDNMARALDAIIRPDGLKLGGNRKTKSAPQKSIKR
jgi:hypothetical protein